MAENGHGRADRHQVLFASERGEASASCSRRWTRNSRAASSWVALYCAGKRRLCVPQARFLMHPVSMNFREGASYEKPRLLELVKSLRVDMDNGASSRRREYQSHSIQAGG